MSTTPGALRRNGLTLFFGAIFVVTLVGQALTGVALFNSEQRAAGLDAISLLAYVTSSAFAVDVAENWQSEFLQFLLYIGATVWFVQRGSPESKKLGEEGRESDEQQKVADHADARSPAWARRRGWRLSVYSHSLVLVMGAIFLGSWFAQSIAGRTQFNEEQLRDLQDPVSYLQYLARPDFWNRTLQNWQSEFLAVGAMVAFSIYLRQRGSSESKPVGTPHGVTSVESE